MAVATSTALLIAGTTAAVAGAGAAVYSSNQAEKAQEKLIASGEAQTQSQLQAAKEAREAAAMTPEEKAYQSMLMKRAETELNAPVAADITESYMPKALESLQKYYMQRGWSPSPGQTGLLIEPSQQVAKDVALQNALLRQASQQSAWSNALAVYPQSQRLAEQGAPLQALPTTAGAYNATTAAQQLVAQQKQEQALATQKALGSLLMSYSSPLLTQRTATGGGTSIIPEYNRMPTLNQRAAQTGYGLLP